MTTDTNDRIRRMQTADLRPNPDNPRGPVVGTQQRPCSAGAFIGVVFVWTAIGFALWAVAEMLGWQTVVLALSGAFVGAWLVFIVITSGFRRMRL